MSIPDPSAGVAQAAAQVPSHADAPPTHAPTPGLALSGARVPGAPSSPDWDVASIASLATALYSAPQASPDPAPAPVAAPFAPASSPFDVPLRFDAIEFPQAFP